VIFETILLKLMRLGGRIVPCLCAVVNSGSREGVGQDPRGLGIVGLSRADLDERLKDASGV